MSCIYIYKYVHVSPYCTLLMYNRGGAGTPRVAWRDSPKVIPKKLEAMVTEAVDLCTRLVKLLAPRSPGHTNIQRMLQTMRFLTSPPFWYNLAVRGIYFFEKWSRDLNFGSRPIPNASLWSTVDVCQILRLWRRQVSRFNISNTQDWVYYVYTNWVPSLQFWVQTHAIGLISGYSSGLSNSELLG